MTDVATDTEQVVDGYTKQELRDAARARNPRTGTPGVDEPQRVKNQVDRAREAEGRAPLSSLATQEETEATVDDARADQWTAWTEPTSEAEEMAEGAADRVHAVDDEPGGRYAEGPLEGVEAVLSEQAVDTGSLGKERTEADDERLAERAKHVEADLERRRGENTGVTGTDDASSSDASDPKGAADTPVKPSKAATKKATARKRAATKK